MTQNAQLCEEIAWDGTFTQKRVWPRTGPTGSLHGFAEGYGIAIQAGDFGEFADAAVSYLCLHQNVLWHMQWLDPESLDPADNLTSPASAQESCPRRCRRLLDTLTDASLFSEVRFGGFGCGQPIRNPSSMCWVSAFITAQKMNSCETGITGTNRKRRREDLSFWFACFGDSFREGFATDM